LRRVRIQKHNHRQHGNFVGLSVQCFIHQRLKILKPFVRKPGRTLSMAATKIIALHIPCS
jgi:hypothetical protein